MLKKKRMMLECIIFRTTNTVAKFLTNKMGFGLNEILGIAAGIIIAAIIVIPGLKGFTKDIIEKLNEWWRMAQTNLLSLP